MIPRSLVVLALAVVASACTYVHGVDVSGSGTKASETRAVANFTEVRASGAFRLEIRSGAAAPSVVVEGDDNLVPLFETEVSGATLKLQMPSGSYSPKVPLVVRVETPSVTDLGASGAISTTVEALTGPEFEAALAGACKLIASGAVSEFRTSSSGASEIQAFDVAADSVVLKLAGASKAHVRAAKSLRVDASGASTVRYRGEPQVESSTSGASSVRPD